MKRNANIIILLMLVFTLLFSSVAFAGITGLVKGLAVSKLVGAAVAGVFGIFGLLGYKVVQYKRLVKEGVDCITWFYSATRANSEHGRAISAKELDEGLKQFGEFGIQAAGVIKNSGWGGKK